MLQELFLAARPSDLRFGGDFLGVFFFFGDGSTGSSSLSTTGALGIGESGCGLRLPRGPVRLAVATRSRSR